MSSLKDGLISRQAYQARPSTLTSHHPEWQSHPLVTAASRCHGQSPSHRRYASARFFIVCINATAAPASGTRKERSCRSRPRMSVLGGWSQPVDATLYLMERWSVLWVEDFIEGLLRQRGRSYGIAGSEGESLKAIGRAFGKPSSSIYFLVAPHGGIRPAQRRRSRLADACGTRGDFQRRYGRSIGTIDRQVAWPLNLDGEPGNEPQRRLETILNVRNWTPKPPPGAGETDLWPGLVHTANMPRHFSAVIEMLGSTAAGSTCFLLHNRTGGRHA